MDMGRPNVLGQMRDLAADERDPVSLTSKLMVTVTWP